MQTLLIWLQRATWAIAFQGAARGTPPQKGAVELESL
jgi:hypothetical protein